MIVIAGNSHPELAATIASELAIPLIIANTRKFEDQELRVQIDGQLYDQVVVIVQSTSNPANDNLMELLLLADTAKRAGANSIIAVMPYFGYGRQDRPSYSYGPISASLVAKLIETSGINRIITIDLHSRQSEGFFNIGVQNFDPTLLFAKLFENKADHVVVSPDIGGLVRAQKLAKMLNLDLAVIDKSRASNGKCIMNSIIGDVQGKHCIVIDDIVDTGGTLREAGNLLMRQNARSVHACVTHAVLSKSGMEILADSQIENLYVTNSIKHKSLPGNIKIVDISKIFVEALTDLIANS